ncbi:MAG: Two-component system sensor histidine kinase [Nitrospira sp.]|jgi:general secretion pathway protein A|nr:MAG: Two-component system sensor histidine kinase [Nitrospira sp.]
MRRRLPWMLAWPVVGAWLTVTPSTWALDPSQHSTLPFQTILELEQIARLLAILLDSGRAVVNDNQTLLDDPAKADKGFTPEVFERQLLDMFRGRAGIDLQEIDTVKLPSRDKVLLKELVAVSKQVIADDQANLNRHGAGFKGFIPAVFGARVATRFTAKTGVRLKQTALAPRNPANRPDPYERIALEAFADASYPREKVISEMAANSSALRLMFPLYATRHCLDCHGGPKGGLDRTGHPREGLTLGQNAGAISVLLPVTK